MWRKQKQNVTDMQTDEQRTVINMCRFVSLAQQYKQGETDGHTDGRTDNGQIDHYVALCFTGDTKIGFAMILHTCYLFFSQEKPSIKSPKLIKKSRPG